MRISRAVLLASCGLVAVVATAGCSDPNEPTTPGTAPVILDVQPASPSASPAEQAILVSGENFSSEPIVILRAPGGAPTSYTGQSISAHSSRSLTVNVLLDVPGTWGITVRNNDSIESTIFSFAVVTTTGNAPPQATSVSPSVISASTTAQVVTVNGSNFRPGLSVLVTDPNGSTTTLSSGLISAQTETSFSTSITFSVVGTYSITVHNLDGTESAPLSVLVTKPPAS